MNRSYLLTALLFAGVILFLALPAQAHKLNVFCWTGDQQVYGEAFFSGGRKAKTVQVHVQNAASHASLLTTETDEEGKFQFTPPQQAVAQKSDLLITVETGDGHRGEWPLTADEYLSAASDPTGAAQSPEEKSAVTSGASVDREAVRAIVRQELNRELLPIKRHLAEEREKKAGPRDILGGIGCILGLAGILAWFQAKKKKKTSADG
jgi:nickel transport protein